MPGLRRGTVTRRWKTYMYPKIHLKRFVIYFQRCTSLLRWWRKSQWDGVGADEAINSFSLTWRRLPVKTSRIRRRRPRLHPQADVAGASLIGRRSAPSRGSDLISVWKPVYITPLSPWQRAPGGRWQAGVPRSSARALPGKRVSQ